MPSTPGSEPKELNRQLLLETVLYDLLWTVFHIGALATLLNGYARTSDAATLKPWRHLLKDGNKVMQLALRYGPEVGLTPTGTATIAALYSDLATEKLALAMLMDGAKTRAGAEPQGLAAACTAWRGLAKQARSALSAIDEAAVRRFGEFLIEDVQTLRQFLGEAAAGSDKRVGKFGEIALPVLKQVRHQPRIAIAGRCTVIAGDISIGASPRDVSVKGLGITCEEPLPDEATITVVFEDGRQCKARVASRRGNQIGLLFETRLGYDDPLLRQGTGADGKARPRSAA